MPVVLAVPSVTADGELKWGGSALMDSLGVVGGVGDCSDLGCRGAVELTLSGGAGRRGNGGCRFVLVNWACCGDSCCCYGTCLVAVYNQIILSS